DLTPEKESSYNVPFYISGYRIAGGLLWEPKNYHGSALFGRTALTS
ncbi:hypothetical protein LCGC14_3156950, partial [marine sediment metagenome]